MHLTLYTDYALRVLIYLAAQEGREATIAEVANRYGISKNHLVKVAHELGQHGFIVTRRGRKGGIGLGAPAGELTVGEVVRKMEPNLCLVECFDRASNTCHIAPACALRPMLAEALEAFLTVLDGKTLAMVIKDREALAGLLQAPPETSGG